VVGDLKLIKKIFVKLTKLRLGMQPVSCEACMVVQPDPFRGMGARRNFAETTVGPRLKAGPKVKNGRSSVKDGAPERLRCGQFRKRLVGSCR